ncbi:hypothetical protein GSH05_20255 [Burkholderia pseudomallei]|uniref:Uncharacterized protein n=1 Tax=Burkholderia pseudomallei TaxID=28450 RepID=A0AAX0UFY4_BURPE|nr:hypothetical protein BHT10_13895 [Burkholderia pseudomallei]MXN80239.1 hypothetical protein [Burkholderia sp. 4701]MXN87550.1 hypothetical protein [Burkholderia sp. 4812]AYX08553.1 hypothetical protein EGY14_34475 [Burkholderia pseudomallei]MBG1246348.1 hypothetical protein [Burkholderia pseudomallei]
MPVAFPQSSSPPAAGKPYKKSLQRGSITVSRAGASRTHGEDARSIAGIVSLLDVKYRCASVHRATRAQAGPRSRGEPLGPSRSCMRKLKMA